MLFVIYIFIQQDIWEIKLPPYLNANLHYIVWVCVPGKEVFSNLNYIVTTLRSTERSMNPRSLEIPRSVLRKSTLILLWHKV